MANNNVNIVIKGEYTDKDIKRAMGDLDRLQAAGMSTGAKMQAFGSQMQSMGQSIAKVGKSMTVGVTLPIVGVGVAATKMAMDFDTSLTKMVSLVGLTRTEVDGMRGDIIAMASQYGKSAKEAADAMFFITSAGLRGADAMETLEASLKGAAIGLGDVETIADLATSAMNAYGPATLSATKATSILRTAVEQGKLESTQLASAMGSVLPVASALGVGFDEAAAAMAAMSRTGTNASEASTQLRGILSQITKETPKGAKALASVGLSYEGLRKQIREEGLLSTLQTLVGAFDGNTVATSAFFGNVRALTGVMDLLGTGADTTQSIFDALASTTADDLNPALAAAAETTGFKLQQAFATMKNSLIEFGDIIAPFVAQFAEKVAQLGQAFQNLSPQTKQFIVQGLAIAAAIGPVLLVVGKLVAAIGGVIKIVGGLVLAFNPLTIKIAAVVAAIGVVVGAFKLAWDNSAFLRTAVGDLMRSLENLGRSIMGAVTGAFRALTGAGNGVGDIFKTIGQVLGVVFGGAVTVVSGVVKVLTGIIQVWGKALEVGITILRMVATVIRGVVLVAFDVLMNKLGPISAAFRAVATGVRAAFTGIASVVSAAFRGVVGAVEKVINFAIGAINAMIDAYNKLAGILPGVSQITRIAEFRFTALSSAANGAAGATMNAASASGFNAREAERQGTAVAAASKEVSLSTPVINANTGATGGNTKAKNDNAKATDKQAEKTKKFQSVFDDHMTKLKAATADIKKSYDDMSKSVSDAIFGVMDTSEIDPNRIGENGEKVGGTWLDGLIKQADKAISFADKVSQVIKLGLEPGTPAFNMVLDVAKRQGVGILDELITGGADTIKQTKDIVNGAVTAADRVGLEAADSFYGAGLASAKATEEGFAKRFGKGGPGFNKLNRLMDHVASSLTRTATITVRTVYEAAGIDGKRAMGGPVTANKAYLVGERGPEVLVMGGQSGSIIPNHDLSRSMTGRTGGGSVGGGSSVINLTVNAGMGTQGAEVGRQIVDALKSYERVNGPVYASVR
jgi:TP901 family phage tail tape measure protein